MNNKQLQTLCDIATEAHKLAQQNFKDIYPIIGVSQKMRDIGIPADAMTIDCLNSKKRIILILHDNQHGIISYQFSFKEKDPDEKFEHIPFDELTAKKMCEWIEHYFFDS